MKNGQLLKGVSMRVKSAVLCLLVTAGVGVAGAEGLSGIETGDLDRSVDPCTDFFEYANGTWRRQNPIPPSMQRWSRRWQAGETAKEQLRVILDAVSARRDWAAGSTEQLIGDFYSSCMDASGRERAGLGPAQPLFARIEAAGTPHDVARLIRELHELAIFVPFGLGGASDLHEPGRVIADVSAGGLGLPDRDYYLKPEDRFREAREKYVRHVAAVLRLAGEDPAVAEAGALAVMRLETRLAEASLDNVALRDPQATDHKTDFGALQRLAPRLDFAAYFEAAALPRAALNVQQPKFLEAVDRELQATPVADWRRYLKWHVLHATADYLPLAFEGETFAFYGKALGGTQEMKPAFKRCVEATDALLGEALGRKYVEKHFPPEAKARMQELVRNLLLAMKDTIAGLDWMGAETKERALEKLATFNPKVGYPDSWKDYSSVRVTRDSFFENAMAGARFLVRDDRATIGKPVDRGRWGMTPPTSNAYYNPLLNEIVFPAGILQPPAFGLDKLDAVNYGAIGVVIGHEISHGFDDQGAQFDAEGRLRNWWTEEDMARFRERGQCVVDQFEGYFVEPGLHHNGKLVLGESIGDLAGAKIAYLGFKKSLEGKPPAPTLDGFTPEQQFFVAWGQFRGDAIRPETQRLMVQGDPHPTGKYRVIGPLSNLPAFHEAFACKAGAPMVRPKERRCEVW